MPAWFVEQTSQTLRWTNFLHQFSSKLWRMDMHQTLVNPLICQTGYPTLSMSFPHLRSSTHRSYQICYQPLYYSLSNCLKCLHARRIGADLIFWHNHSTISNGIHPSIQPSKQAIKWLVVKRGENLSAWDCCSSLWVGCLCCFCCSHPHSLAHEL